MPNITLSIRDENAPIWDDARRYADAHHTTLSGLATMALARYLNHNPGDNNDITVVTRVNGQVTRVTFTGRWLVKPESTDLDRASGRIGVYSRGHGGIAHTSKGRIAVYMQDNKGAAHLADYNTLAEARDATPDSLTVTSDDWRRAELAMTPPTRLDI